MRLMVTCKTSYSSATFRRDSLFSRKRKSTLDTQRRECHMPSALAWPLLLIDDRRNSPLTYIRYEYQVFRCYETALSKYLLVCLPKSPWVWKQVIAGSLSAYAFLERGLWYTDLPLLITGMLVLPCEPVLEFDWTRRYVWGFSQVLAQEFLKPSN